jgi:hypothetical protein
MGVPESEFLTQKEMEENSCITWIDLLLKSSLNHLAPRVQVVSELHFKRVLGNSVAIPLAAA